MMDRHHEIVEMDESQMFHLLRVERESFDNFITEEDAIENFRLWLDNRSTIKLVEHERLHRNFIRGYLIATHRNQYNLMFINYIAVERNSRRLGIGSALLRRLIDLTVNNYPTVNRIELIADPNTEDLRRFYLSNGFLEINGNGLYRKIIPRFFTPDVLSYLLMQELNMILN